MLLHPTMKRLLICIKKKGGNFRDYEKTIKKIGGLMGFFQVSANHSLALHMTELLFRSKMVFWLLVIGYGEKPILQNGKRKIFFFYYVCVWHQLNATEHFC